MKIKNLNIRKKLKSIALAGSLSAALISGCGTTDNNFVPIKIIEETTETNPKIDMYIIFGEGTATLVEITHQSVGDSYQTPSGIIIEGTLTDNYRFLKDITYEEAEEFARDVMGENVKINYFDCEPQKTLKRKK